MAILRRANNAFAAPGSYVSWETVATWDVVSQSATLIVLDNLDGTFTRVIGTGFVLDGGGNPLAGTVREVRRVAANGTTLETIGALPAGSTLVSFEASIASGVGGTLRGADIILGGTGNDTLDGGNDMAADILLGRAGHDTYILRDNDTIFEGSNAGTDTIVFQRSNLTYTIGANVENLTYAGIGSLAITGNTLANAIKGGKSADTLKGEAGADTLDGGSDSAVDTLIGGTGADTYIVHATGPLDIITEAANQGIDTVRSARSFTLGANLENLTLQGSGNIDGTGNGLANVVTGNSGNNVLDGGIDVSSSIIDTLRGGQGNDIYIVRDARDLVTENANQGSDTVRSFVTHTLAANVENLELQGTANINGTGNSLANHLVGNSGNNSLGGGGNNDTLEGGGGNDRLNGGAGIDTAVFSGNYSDYDIVKLANNAGFTITHARGAATDGADTLTTTVEFAQFDDRLVDLRLNLPATITGAKSGAIDEDASPNTVSGDLNAADVDNPADSFQPVAAPAATANGYGTYTVTAAGAWTYALDNGNAAVNALNDNQTLTDSFTVRSADGTSQVVSITITGSDDDATIVASAMEDISVTEARFSGESTHPGDPSASGTLTVSDPNPGESVFQVPLPAALVGDYGDFTFNDQTGAWTYTLDPARSNALSAGDMETETLTVTSLDGSASYDIVVNVTGANDRPMISIATPAAVAEGNAGDDPAIEVVDLFARTTIVDPDAGDQQSFVQNSVSVGLRDEVAVRGFSALTVDQLNGTVTYDRNAFDFLAHGESAQYRFVYTVQSGPDDGIRPFLDIEITGANDAPVLAANTGVTVGEDGAVAWGQTILQAIDVDNPADEVIFTVTSLPQNGFLARSGTEQLAVGSTFTQADIAAFRVFYFHDGSEATSDSFKFQVDDLNEDGSAPVEQTFTFQIFPGNDAPMVSSVSPAAVVEGNAGDPPAVETVDVLAQTTIVDPDVNDSQSFVQNSISVAAAAGSVTMNTGLLTIDNMNGTVSYDRNAFDFLADGESALFDVTYQVRSGRDTRSQTIQIEVDGVNDAPTIAAVVLDPIDDTAAGDDFAPVTGTLAGADRDAADTLSYSLADGEDGMRPLGALSVAANGGYTFTPDDAAINALDDGESQTLSFSVAVSDGDATTTTTLAVTITGTNDAPTIAAVVLDPIDDTAGDDDFAPVTGTLAGEDRDAADTLSYSLADGENGMRPLGALSVAADGGYIFTPDDAAINALDDGESQTLSFDVAVSDGDATTTTRLEVTITGANDAPVNEGPLFSFVAEEPDPDAIRLVSQSDAGVQGNSFSAQPSISADGRYVTFTSGASNLFAGDTNFRDDVFVADTQAGTIARVSQSDAGVQGNNFSNGPSISADGRFVTFVSYASNLVAGDANNAADVFVFNTQAGTIALVSQSGDGVQANNHSFEPSISADGRYVTFQSSASNLVAGDTNNSADVFMFDTQAGTIARVSQSAAGVQGNGFSFQPSISADGRYVTFISDASNLVAGDTNGRADVFVFDRQAGTIARVSQSDDGVQSNGNSAWPSISADGHYVAFRSNASSLVAGDTNNAQDVFVFDTQAGTIARVSQSDASVQGNNHSFEPSISADGRYVTFASDATNLVAGDTNGTRDVFVFDTQAGTIARVSQSDAGAQGNHQSVDPSISADGRFVAFTSVATNLVAGDSNGAQDVFVADLDKIAANQTLALQDNEIALDVSVPDNATDIEVDWGNGDVDQFSGLSGGETVRARTAFDPEHSRSGSLTISDGSTILHSENFSVQTAPEFQAIRRVSQSDAGVQGNSSSFSPSISAEGRYVTFASAASNLVAGDSNGTPDVFVYDTTANTIERVSQSDAGVQGNNASFEPSISADGRVVAFTSRASNLTANDINHAEDVFVFDTQAGTIARISPPPGAGVHVHLASSQPSISADGRIVAFTSAAANLVAGDTNGVTDVFVFDTQAGTIARVSQSDAGVQGNSFSNQPSISADGRYVTFVSHASNLVAGDTNGSQDIFVYDTIANTIERVSQSDAGVQGNSDSAEPSISADGRYVTFASAASNLVAGDSNVAQDVFVYDTTANTIERVSQSDAGVQGNLNSDQPSISADGRYVTFVSAASNLVAGDSNGAQDVFVYDTAANTIERVSQSDAGVQGNLTSIQPSISADGRYVTFESDSSNLAAGDTNGARDVFVVDLEAPGATLTGNDGIDILIGHEGPDTLVGRDGNDRLSGAGREDFLDGGEGNDLLSGGAGADRFFFFPEFGKDRVSDFAGGAGAGDVLWFHSVLFDDAQAAFDATQDDAWGNAVVMFDADNSVTLLNVSKSTLSVDDFAVIAPV